MKIIQLAIENFRIFKGRHEFDFSNKDFVLICGPNGHGKSTIFDAVHWCFTGEIPRYKGTREHQNFNYICNEKAYREPPTTVKVVVTLRTEEGDIRTIARSIRKTMKTEGQEKVKIDNGSTVGKIEGAKLIRNILLKKGVVDGEDTSKQGDSLDLTDFLSSTQLLSQDQIQAFIHDNNPQERFRLIESVLGLKKFGVVFAKYLLDSKRVVEQEKQKLNDDIRKLSELEIANTAFLKSEIDSWESIGEIPERKLVEKVNQIIEISGNFIDMSSITVINESVRDELSKARIRIVEQRIRSEAQNTLLIGARGKLVFTQEIYQSEKSMLEEKQTSLMLKRLRRERGKKKIGQRLEQLRVVQQDRNIYQDVQTKLIENRNEIQRVQQDKQSILHSHVVLKVVNEFMGVKNFLDQYDNRRQQQKSLEKRIQLFDIVVEADELLSSLLRIDTRIEIQEQLLTEKKSDLQSIERQIGEIGNEINDDKEQTIPQMVRDLQHFVLKEGDPHQNCPVCNTSFTEPRNLHTEIHQLWEATRQKSSALQQKIVDLQTRNNELLREVLHAESILLTLKSQKVTVEERRNKVLYEINILETTIPVLILELSREQSLLRQQEHTKFFDSYQIAYSLLGSLSKLKDEAVKLEHEEKLLIQQMEILKNNSGRWSIYLWREEVVLRGEIIKLEGYLSKITGLLEVIDQQKRELDSERISMEIKWFNRQQALQEIREEFIGFSDELSNLENLINELTRKSAELGNLDLRLGTLIHEIQGFLSNDRLAKLREEDNQLKLELGILNKTYSEYTEIIEGIERLRDGHELVQSDLIANMLLDYSEVIDRVFMQISPHPIYRHVHLVPRKGNLYIIMDDEEANEENIRNISDAELEKKFNASLTFSSGQANVLAVSIFLALNTTQQWTNLSLLAIDDPFQNLDDVNAFSFIDVLNKSSENKQVFISTHSEDFANLIRAKMEINPDRVGYISLYSYSRDKVDIHTNCLSSKIR